MCVGSTPTSSGDFFFFEIFYPDCDLIFATFIPTASPPPPPPGPRAQPRRPRALVGLAGGGERCRVPGTAQGAPGGLHQGAAAGHLLVGGADQQRRNHTGRGDSLEQRNAPEVLNPTSVGRDPKSGSRSGWGERGSQSNCTYEWVARCSGSLKLDHGLKKVENLCATTVIINKSLDFFRN